MPPSSPDFSSFFTALHEFSSCRAFSFCSYEMQDFSLCHQREPAFHPSLFPCPTCSPAARPTVSQPLLRLVPEFPAGRSKRAAPCPRSAWRSSATTRLPERVTQEVVFQIDFQDAHVEARFSGKLNFPKHPIAGKEVRFWGFENGKATNSEKSPNFNFTKT